MTPGHWINPKRIVHESGVRSGALEDIQLVCGAGAFAVDVIVREHSSPDRIEFIGQVMQGENLDQPVANLRLVLVEPNSGTAAASTRTDGFGEFEMESWRTDVPLGLGLGDSPDAPHVVVWEIERIDND